MGFTLKAPARVFRTSTSTPRDQAPPRPVSAPKPVKVVEQKALTKNLNPQVHAGEEFADRDAEAATRATRADEKVRPVWFFPGIDDHDGAGLKAGSTYKAALPTTNGGERWAALANAVDETNAQNVAYDQELTDTYHTEQAMKAEKAEAHARARQIAKEASAAARQQKAQATRADVQRMSERVNAMETRNARAMAQHRALGVPFDDVDTRPGGRHLRFNADTDPAVREIRKFAEGDTLDGKAPQRPLTRAERERDAKVARHIEKATAAAESVASKVKELGRRASARVAARKAASAAAEAGPSEPPPPPPPPPAKRATVHEKLAAARLKTPGAPAVDPAQFQSHTHSDAEMKKLMGDHYKGSTSEEISAAMLKGCYLDRNGRLQIKRGLPDAGYASAADHGLRRS